MVAQSRSENVTQQGFWTLCKNGDHEGVSRMLPRVSLRRTNEQGLTALMIAAQHGQAEVVKMLLPGSQINQHSPHGDGKTALFFAIDAGSIAVVNLLLPRANVHHQNAFGHDVWSYALRCKRNPGFEKGLVKYLLPRLDLSRKGDDGTALGDTVLVLAAQNNNIQAVQAMLASTSTSTVLSEDAKNTAFFEACAQDHVNVAQALFAQVNPDQAHGVDGRTALTQAAYWRCKEVVRWLAPLVTVDIPDSNGMTPLMNLVMFDVFGKPEGFQALWDVLLPLSNPHLVNRNGSSLLSMALRQKNMDVLDAVLTVSTAASHAPNMKGETPIGLATRLWPAALPLLAEHEQALLLGGVEQPPQNARAVRARL